MYYTYILRTSADTLYVGQTNDLERRIAEHRSKSTKSAKYVRYFDSFELVYQEEFKTRGEAMKREAQLKKMTRIRKERVVAGDD